MNIKFLKILAALSICALLFSSCSQKNTDTKVADKNENAKENTENQADGETKQPTRLHLKIPILGTLLPKFWARKQKR